jgi:hypothetical protein
MAHFKTKRLSNMGGGMNKASMDPKAFVSAYEKYGSIKAVARALKKPYAGVRETYELAVAEGLMEPMRPGRKSTDHMTATAKGTLKVKEPVVPVIEGSLRARSAPPLPLKKRGVTRFLFTSAQNNTPIFDKFWKNLHVYADYIGAKVHVSRFAYIKSGLGARGDKKAWLDREDYKAAKDLWWDGRLTKYLLDDRATVAPGLVFVGDANILPTKAKPLNGYETLTGRASAIFPHVKFALSSIATVNVDEPTKFNYTTGTVTMRNYILRDAGLKAEFHHCYGALLVEVSEDGSWYCRQVNADSEGSFYEFGKTEREGIVLVAHGKITKRHRGAALNSGDNHAEDEDTGVFDATWGAHPRSLIEVSRVKVQFYNDLCSFNARSHHNIKDPHNQFLHHVLGTENVRNNMEVVKAYLKRTVRPWCRNVVVDSNHDRHVARWLKEQDGRRDPVNASYWMDLNKATYDYMKTEGSEPNHLQLALRLIDPTIEKRLKVEFLPADGSFIICHDSGGGIECGLHGDRSPNGARGSAAGIAKMGRKANIGHSHSACIIDGVYQAGTSSTLKLDYNHGPSSWSQSHVLTYPNGKRTIITVWRGQWRAWDTKKAA